jgi:ribosomal protein L40E
MKEEQDDLTLVYMFGYKNGKDSMKAEIERLLLIEQGAADLCDKCGWRMKFPNEECRNCENAKLRDEIERLRAAIAALKERETVNGGTPRGGAAVPNCCGGMGDGAVSGVSDV